MFSNSKEGYAGSVRPTGGKQPMVVSEPPAAMPVNMSVPAAEITHTPAAKTYNEPHMPMTGTAETGLMPHNGLLAAAYVPIQRHDTPKYTKEDALKNGTLFPGLNLPYERYIPSKEVAGTPQGELMALSFVLNELGLYLDTHPHDKEALRLRNGFVEMYQKATKKMESEHGPMTQDTVMENGYTWVDSPWPWEK